MALLIPLFRRAGVKAMFSGHEHNFQHSHVDGIDYFVTGAAGKYRGGTPDGLREAHTVSWSAECHFLLVRIDGARMVVRAIGEHDPEARALRDIIRYTADGGTVALPVEVTR